MTVAMTRTGTMTIVTGIDATDIHIHEIHETRG
jgi:hypothetical protein